MFLFYQSVISDNKTQTSSNPFKWVLSISNLLTLLMLLLQSQLKSVSTASGEIGRVY